MNPHPLKTDLKFSLLGLALILAGPRLPAATQIWDTNVSSGITNGTGTWTFNSTVNWSDSTAGSNPLRVWSSNADAAQFVITGGNSTVTVDATGGQVGAFGLFFSGTGNGNTTTLAATGGATLQLGAGGLVATQSNQVVAISAPVELSAAQTWSSTSLRTNSNGAAVRITGVLSTLTGTTALTFDGRGLSNAADTGNSAQRVGFALGGNNTFAGSTTVTGGATLQLDYASNSGSKLDDTRALVLAGGSIRLGGGTNVVETVGSTVFATGANTIFSGSAGGAGGVINRLDLGALTHRLGATLDVTNAVSGIASTTTQNSGGIVGGWATLGGSSWAVGSTDGVTATNLTSTNGTSRSASSAWLTTDNVSSTASESGIGSKTINALRVTTASVALALDSAATLQVTSGGIIAANTGQSITGGKITTGLASGELFVHTPNAFTLGSAISDNGVTPTILVKAGASSLTLTGASTHTGGTIINSGSLIVGSTGSLGGSVLVQGGATFDVTANGFTVASGKSLGGGGTVAGNTVVASGGGLISGVTYLDDQAASRHVTGTLSFSNNLTFDSGAQLTLGLGTQSDLIALTNAGATLTGATGTGGITLNLFDAGGLATGQTYTLISWAPGVTLTGLELSDFTLSGLAGSLQLGVNSIEFVAAAIPEPGVCALVLGAFSSGLVVLARRRRAGGR